MVLRMSDVDLQRAYSLARVPDLEGVHAIPRRSTRLGAEGSIVRVSPRAGAHDTMQPQSGSDSLL